MRVKRSLLLLVPFVGFIVLLYTYPNFHRTRKPLFEFFHWSLLPDGVYQATCHDRIDNVPKLTYELSFVFDHDHYRFAMLSEAHAQHDKLTIVNDEGTFRIELPSNVCRFSKKLNFLGWNLAWQQLERRTNQNSSTTTFVGVNVFGWEERTVVNVTDQVESHWAIGIEWKTSNFTYTHVCTWSEQQRQPNVDATKFFQLPFDCRGDETNRAWFDSSL